MEKKRVYGFKVVTENTWCLLRDLKKKKEMNNSKYRKPQACKFYL